MVSCITKALCHRYPVLTHLAWNLIAPEHIQREELEELEDHDEALNCRTVL